MSNPLLAKIEGASASTEEENAQAGEAERVIEVRKQSIEGIIREEGGAEATGAKERIKSATAERELKEKQRGKEIYKQHKEKMKKIKGGNFKKNINPAFFSKPKADIDSNKGCSIEFDPVKAAKYAKASAEQSEAKRDEIKNELKKEETKRKEEERKQEEEEKVTTVRENEIAEIDRRNRERFLAEGEYVYELFAVLLHRGSAHGGHYSACIKNLSSNNWFSYNDAIVRPIRLSDLQATFGSNDPHSTANAYTLMYRKAGLPKINAGAEDIPDYIAETIDKEEKEEIAQRQVMKERELKMQVKVFYGDNVKVIDTTRTSTYEQLLSNVVKAFELKERMQNCRLRSYNVPNQIMQDTYTGKESTVLEELRIYPQKSLALEVKKDEETFADFDPNMIQIKANAWRPNVTALDETALQPVRIFVRRFGKLAELVEVLEKAVGIPREFLLYGAVTGRLGKKLPVGSSCCIEVLSGSEKAEKTLAQLRINEGINLFVEDMRVKHPMAEEYKKFSGEDKCKWEIVTSASYPRSMS